MTTATDTNAKVEALRRKFKKTREVALFCMTREQFDEQIARAKASTPEQFVAAAEAVVCDCDHCQATGVYSWGASVNGKMSHSGDCYRCLGKGWMNVDDMARFKVWTGYAIVKAFGF